MKILWGLAVSSVLILAAFGAQPQLDLHEKSVAELQALMVDGELTSVQLVEYFQQRITKYDVGEKGLHSVIVVNPDALEIARQLDRERSEKGRRGPLHGIPVLLKDNIDTADNMPNTAGSLLLKENFPEQDAPLVANLRAAGAVIFGKANLSEWVNFRGSPSSSGWSGVGGQVNNPYQEGANPCGSSSGSAVSVAADLVTVSVGTETDGSLTCPGAVNGIVAIKPTLHLISQQGIIPISHSQDSAGPMARTVTDAVMLLGALVEGGSDYSDALVADGLRGKRIGVVRNLAGYNSELDKVFNEALAAMKLQGAELVDSCNISTNGQFSQDAFTVLLYEFKAGINDYLSRASVAGVGNLSDVIAGNNRLAELELDKFGQELFEYAQQSGDLSAPQYLAAKTKAQRLAGPEGIDTTLADCDVDLLVAPTTGPAWQTNYRTGDAYAGSASRPAAVAGYPHITVPMGYVGELPVGLSLFSGANTEKVLIEAAYGYEQATKYRKAPSMEWLLSVENAKSN